MTLLFLLACPKGRPLDAGRLCPDVVDVGSVELPFDSGDVARALSGEFAVGPQERAAAHLELSLEVIPRDEGRAGRMVDRTCPPGRVLEFDADLVWVGEVDGHPFMARLEAQRIHAWDAAWEWVIVRKGGWITHEVVMDPAFTRAWEQAHWGDGDPRTGSWTLYGPMPSDAEGMVFLDYSEGTDGLGGLTWTIGRPPHARSPLRDDPAAGPPYP